MKFIVATPYRENSILAIARYLESVHLLEHFYSTMELSSLKKKVMHLPLIGHKISTELSRREFPGIELDHISNVASVSEVFRIVLSRFFRLSQPNWVVDAMFRVKVEFDLKLATQLRDFGADVFIGMYGSSLDCFQQIHRQGGICVLNFVNSHPEEQNNFLTEYAGIEKSHHEMVPEWMTTQVIGEIELADLVLVPSQFVVKQLLDHGVAEDKIITIPYGVDLQAFYPSPKPNLEGEIVECLFVGHISHRKGVKILLQAAWKCQNLPIKFRLIGPMVSQEVLYNMPNNIVYEGADFPGNIADAMRHADMFVLPTIEDSFALVVLEAMSTGLPVITTNNAGSSELIENGLDGIVIPAGDVKALVESISRLVEAPELRLKMGDAARLKVQSAHSWEAYGEAVSTAVNELNKDMIKSKEFLK